MWGISSWAVAAEKHLCQALKGGVRACNTACISSSLKCPFYTHFALYPRALSDGTSSAGQELSHTQFTLIPYPWKGTSRAGGRRRAPEWDDNGDEEERGSLRRGKREGAGAEHGESFS